MTATARGPDALLPVWVARLLGFAALASLGALEWQRMVEGLSSGRALLWVAVATAAGAAVLACDALPYRWQGIGTLAVVALGLLAAVAVSGVELDLLRPSRWAELVEGVAGGLQSLGTVRMPYAGADAWPRVALQLAGSVLLTLAALLTCWPRPGSRGYPFLALIALLVLVVSPVVSLGGARPLVLGMAIAALTVCFLWLERLPLRPGLGVAVLLGVALAGALPLAAVADRGEPWFDYKAFAEGLGPDDPVRFSWAQGYGPIDWPRDGNEVLRIKSDAPHYWKAVSLDTFDGRTWRAAPPDPREDAVSELREDWRAQPSRLERAEVSVRRMRTRDVIGAGTLLGVEGETRPVREVGPGRWVADSELRRGDSYTAEFHVPEPSAAELREAQPTEPGNRRTDELRVTVPYRPGLEPTERRLGGVSDRRVSEAVVHFRPFGSGAAPYATYPAIGRTSYDGAERALRRSTYRRTWALSQRLLADAETPYEYVTAVNAHLADGFGYSERPTRPGPGRAPLDAFLIDTQDGYCQHFAGAMALLLRMGGVPARVATGFSPGGYSKRRDAWIVRDTDAHAWVEAWFDEHGWVAFDPTPAATPARSQIAALADAPAPAAPGAETGDAGGGDDAGGARPGGLRGDLLFDVDQNPAAGGADAAGEGGVPWWWWPLAAAAALALAAGLRRRQAPGPLSPIDRAVLELEAAMRRSGRPLAPGTTLRQLEQRLGIGSDAAGYLRALSASRYGTGAAPPTSAQRRALRRELAHGLGPAGRLRALWALPPRPR